MSLLRPCFAAVALVVALPLISAAPAAFRGGSGLLRAALLGDEVDFAWPEVAGDAEVEQHPEQGPQHEEESSSFLGHRPTAPAAPPPSGSVEAAPKSSEVLYNHLPKAGGSFLKKVLRDTVGRDRFILEREFDALSTDNVTSGTFTIGSVRNPCEYYVSLWAFGSDGKGSFHAFVNKYGEGLHAATAGKDSPEDIRRFRRWVTAIGTKPPSALEEVAKRDGALDVGGVDNGKITDMVGLESARFAFSYSREPYMEDHDVEVRLSRPPREFTVQDTSHVRRALEKFDSSSIDCWVRAEELVKDTEKCLAKFESMGGRVDWSAFQKGLVSEDQNPSNHAPCTAYFDDATEELVRRMEAPIFNIFGYRTCCADPRPKTRI